MLTVLVFYVDEIINKIFYCILLVFISTCYLNAPTVNKVIYLKSNFRRSAERRRAENISPRLGSAWHVCFRKRKYSRTETTLLVISHQR